MTVSNRDEQLSQVAAPAPLLSDLDRPNHFTTPQSLVQDPGENFLHQSLKTRFTSSHSTIAFPRSLGLSLGLEDPPRLQERTELHFRGLDLSESLEMTSTMGPAPHISGH